jgi:hypothetical protein
MEYTGAKRIEGLVASCYRGRFFGGAFPGRDLGEVCASQDGIPLSFDVSPGFNSDALIEAIAVNNVPAEEDLTKLPWSDPTPDGATPVSTDQLALPPLPALQEYLAGN